jgi:hypothetical protein
MHIQQPGIHLTSSRRVQSAKRYQARAPCQSHLVTQPSMDSKPCACPCRPTSTWRRAALLCHASLGSRYPLPHVQHHSCRISPNTNRPSSCKAKTPSRPSHTTTKHLKPSFATSPLTSGAPCVQQGGGGGSNNGGRGQGGSGSQGPYDPDSSSNSSFHTCWLQQALLVAIAAATAWGVSPGVAAAAGGREGWVATREQYPMERYAMFH